jgi:predicted nucleotidyltransferase component of viral defense system
VLYIVYSYSDPEMIFKGGTALSKFYYSDRFSEDLDFTVYHNQKPAKEKIKQLTDKIIADMPYKTTYGEAPSANKFGTVSAIFAVEGPRYSGKISTIQYIRFEINTTASLLYKEVAMPRAPVYADAGNYVALVMDKVEILSEKIRAIVSVGRKHKERDLYDIYYLLSKKTEINKKIISAKLSESGLMLQKGYISKNIAAVGSTWKYLEPLVQHRLESHEYVSQTVSEILKKNDILL